MAIAAHWDDSPRPADRPREPRRQLRLEAHGSLSSGATTNVLVHNISVTGLLLESRLPLAIGEMIDVDLPLAGARQAKVIWVSGNLFGCQFDAPISPAMLSAAQLRGPAGPGAEIASPPSPDISPGESFGARLQRLRRSRGLTLSQLAAELGVSKPTVWAWEQGKARPVDGRIAALAKALDVGEAEILPGRDAHGLPELLARTRERIAQACGTDPDRIRIMIDL